MDMAHSGEFGFGGERREAEPPASALIAFLHDMYQAGYEAQGSYSADRPVAAGKFIRTVPLAESNKLTKGSHRAIMKPPHPHDQPGTHFEVYALPIGKAVSGAEDRLFFGTKTGSFLIRKVIRGEPQEFELLNAGGLVALIDTNDIPNRKPDLFNDIEETLAAQGRAYERYLELLSCNIVASVD